MCSTLYGFLKSIEGYVLCDKMYKGSKLFFKALKKNWRVALKCQHLQLLELFAVLVHFKDFGLENLKSPQLSSGSNVTLLPVLEVACPLPQLDILNI